MADGYTRSKGLSAGTAVAFAVGNMVGAGVFVLSDLMVQTAGTLAVLSYLLCRILVVFTGLSCAVLVSIFPSDGGGYLYAHHMLGPYLGFIAGWGMYISVTIASAFVLLGLGIYSNRLRSQDRRPRRSRPPHRPQPQEHPEAGRAEVALVAAKIVLLLLVEADGVTTLTPADLTPFFPHGIGAMLDGVAMVFFADLGFQVVAMMGGEIKSSTRVVPLATLAILASIGIVAVIYCSVEDTPKGDCAAAEIREFIEREGRGWRKGVLIVQRALERRGRGSSFSLLGSSFFHLLLIRYPLNTVSSKMITFAVYKGFG